MTGGDKKRRKSAEESPALAQSQEKELAENCARFADICQYFSEQNMDLPPQIVDEARLISRLGVADRIARIKRLNQELMEYLHDSGPAIQIRR